MFKQTLFASLTLFFFATLVSTAPVATTIMPRQTNVGDVTFFGPGLGACGVTNSASDFMVAVSRLFFDSFGPESSANPLCGRQIQATAPGGKTVTVTIEDKCSSCGLFDLDMSPAAFEVLAPLSAGRLQGVSWNLL